MKTRTYMTFDGECKNAIEHYKKALNTTTESMLLFGEMPPNPNFPIPEDYKDRVLQATLIIGDDLIRMSDCGPGHNLNGVETERLSVVLEATVDEIKHAFSVLSEGGKIGMALEETFYSPCAGVVFDKFGVMWNLAAIE